ncbi:hypothetical protein GN958_ATG19758 [Phytophthora infestans]|uniref:Uncharacterized protein n=2 Tax=Phytophthora infestans TaxID=4787 RepID=A0A8S9TQZ3_PHYIN|nr:hypothetical protein GN958_ATG19758 [Phytophthora infestans]
MLDTTAHMLLLLQQAKIKNEHPRDLSFLPLSLSMSCILRQPPADLVPPGLSLHQLDRLPQAILERKLAAMLLDDPLRAFTFVCALVKYTKVTRELLSTCHDHMSNRVSTVEATQNVVQAVIEALPSLDADVEEDEEKDEKQDRKIPEKSVQDETKTAGYSHFTEKIKPNAVATDPAGIMRRAIGRDVGDGSAVLETMTKFPTDARIQSHGVRALKGLIRSVGDPEENKVSAESNPTSISTFDADVDDHLGDRHVEDQKTTEKSSRLMVQMVIDKMKQFPNSLALQRDGLLGLAEYANQADDHIAFIASSGGIISLIGALVALPDDVSANMAGLSVLAHPKIAGVPSRTEKSCIVSVLLFRRLTREVISDESVVRVSPESRRLVLSAMERFPLSEQVQGLSCLALANLSLRQDASMVEIVSKGGLETVVESMKRFSSTALVQAAGSWFIAIISGKNGNQYTNSGTSMWLVLY